MSCNSCLPVRGWLGGIGKLSRRAGVAPDAGEDLRRGGHRPDMASRSALTSHREETGNSED